jgi:hypothetical protein
MCFRKKNKSQRLNEKSKWSVDDLIYMVNKHPESFSRVDSITVDSGRIDRYKSIPSSDDIKRRVESLRVGDVFINAVGTKCYVIEVNDGYLSYGFDRHSIDTKITKMDLYDAIKMRMIRL